MTLPATTVGAAADGLSPSLWDELYRLCMRHLLRFSSEIDLPAAT